MSNRMSKDDELLELIDVLRTAGFAIPERVRSMRELIIAVESGDGPTDGAFGGSFDDDFPEASDGPFMLSSTRPRGPGRRRGSRRRW